MEECIRVALYVGRIRAIVRGLCMIMCMVIEVCRASCLYVKINVKRIHLFA